METRLTTLVTTTPPVLSTAADIAVDGTLASSYTVGLPPPYGSILLQDAP